MLKTKSMLAEPSADDGIRICIIRNPKIYRLHSARFRARYSREIFDQHIEGYAPEQETLQAYRSGRILWLEYVRRFKNEVLIPGQDKLEQLAQRALNENITLLCSEKTPNNCHRKLIAEECKKLVPSLIVKIE